MVLNHLYLYPNIRITIKYACAVNNAKPKLVSPNNSEINDSYYSNKQVLASTPNLQYYQEN